MREWITSDAGTSVSINQGLVEVGIFDWTERHLTAEHDAEETVQSCDIGAKRIIGIFGINNLW